MTQLILESNLEYVTLNKELENKQKLDDEFKNKRAEDYSNKVLNVSSSMNWGVQMYHGNKIQMDTSKAMGK